MTAMKFRALLKKLTWPARVAFVVVFVLTGIVQIITAVAALVTEVAAWLVAAGEAAQRAVVEAGELPQTPMPTGYRTRGMAAWSTP
ncbi:hypothetical protein [Kutzneria sp. NPDC051319]|uniref:hypothetical protein n=1 Tax=Kutzneria sp. NPDC051319 TaxID=3155047 RepID=UPI003419ACCB